MQIVSPSLILAVFATSALAQQTWTSLVDLGPGGDFIAGSPLEPRAVFCQQQSKPGIEWIFVDGRFERRSEAPPAHLHFIEASAYDPTGMRSIAYIGRFAGTAVLTGESWLGVNDGPRWELLATPGLPARLAPALGHDPLGGGLVLFGGMVQGTHFGTAYGDTWRLSGTTWTQLFPNNAPAARAGAASAVDSTSGRLVLFGGRSFHFGAQHFDDTWQWTGSDWLEVATTNAPSPRHGHELASDPDGTGILLYGGFDALGNELGDAWRFDGVDWSPLPSPTGGAPLHSPQFANLNGKLVLFGRVDAIQGPVIGLRFNGVNWDAAYSSSTISLLSGSAFALDTSRGEVVRFGGFAPQAPWPSGLRDETWTFDGTWQRRFPATSPPARSTARMVFDPLHSETVMFGGYADSTALRDTWVWDGADWQERTPPTSPPALVSCSMAFDPTRQGVVLHGSDGTVMHTWLWDGSTWTKLVTLGQVALSYGSLAFDATRDVLCLHATQPPGDSSSLWELHGGDWVLVDPNAPLEGELTFDPLTGNLAVFNLDGRHDLIAGTWHATGQPQGNGRYAFDPVRGGLLSMWTDVQLSTPTPALSEPYGTGCGSGLAATLWFDRRPRLGADMDAVVRAGTAGALVHVLLGHAPASDAIGGCTAWIANPFSTRFGVADASGFASIDSAVPAVPALAGINVYAQAFVAYPAPLLGQFGLSNGLRLQLGL